jgi:hypothetical protein
MYFIRDDKVERRDISSTSPFGDSRGTVCMAPICQLLLAFDRQARRSLSSRLESYLTSSSLNDRNHF